MRFRNFRLIPVLVAMSFFCPIIFSAPVDSRTPADESQVLVKAKGFTLQRSDVEKAAAGKMKELDLEALRAPARIEMRRHTILSETMEELTYNKLFEMESEKRGITPQELTELKVTPRIKPMTPEELDKYFELNKNRLQGTREEIIAQITAFVTGQREKEARREYARELAVEYGVAYLLPPIRFDIKSGTFRFKAILASIWDDSASFHLSRASHTESRRRCSR